MAENTSSRTIAPPSHLDVLNTEEMRKLFPFLSAAPTSPDWCLLLDSDDTITSLRTQRRLRDAASTMLTRAATFRPLKTISCDYNLFVLSWSHLREIAEAAGDYLQELQLGFHQSCSNAVINRWLPTVVDVVQKLPVQLDLTNLKSESVNSNDTDADAYIDLLASRGTHLLDASIIFVVPQNSLQRLTSACPNARFTCFWSNALRRNTVVLHSCSSSEIVLRPSH